MHGNALQLTIEKAGARATSGISVRERKGEAVVFDRPDSTGSLEYATISRPIRLA